MVVSKEEALALLGLKDGATAADVRRAFKIQALKHHPDKNAHNPEAATAAFQRLAAAYQRIISPSADQDWEDLDVSDIFTEEFFEEALRMHEVPAFELMFIHDSMGQGCVPAGGASVWADAGTSADARAKDAMWRRIHESLRKRKRKAEASQAPRPHQGLRRSKPFQNTKEGRLAVFWDFLSDMVRHSEHDFCVVDEASGEVVAESVPLPGRSAAGWSNGPRADQLLEHSHGNSGFLLPAAPSSQQQQQQSQPATVASDAAASSPRRARAQARAPNRGGGVQGDSGPCVRQDLEQEPLPVGQVADATAGAGAQTCTQPVPGDDHRAGNATSNERSDTAGTDHMQQAAPAPAHRVRHNWGFYWTWAKRLLVLKALSMLIRS